MKAQAWYPLALILILALPAGVLFDVRDAGFVADDFAVALAPVDWSFSGLLGGDWGHSPGDPARYRPVVTMLYGVDQALGGRRPLAFHLTNFLLHGLAAALLAEVARRLTGSRVAGALAGMLFAVHPVVHENVVWISGRTHPTATVLVLGALVLYARPDGARRGRAAPAAALILAWAALASYESAVTLPGAVAIVAWVMARERSMVPRLGQAALAAWPSAALVGAYLLFRHVWLASSESTAVTLDPTLARANLDALGTRLLACGACGLGGVASRSLSFWLSAGTLAAGGVAACRSPQLRGSWLAGLGLAAVWFVPFVTFPGYTDRFAYASAAGICLSMAVGLVALGRARPPASRAIVAALVLALAALWSRQLRIEAGDWREAGEIAREIPAQARALLPDPPRGATLRFFRVPMNHGRASVFVTSFHVAVALAYGRSDLDVRFEHAQDDEAIEHAVANRGAHETVLWWDGPSRRVRMAAAIDPR